MTPTGKILDRSRHPVEQVVSVGCHKDSDLPNLLARAVAARGAPSRRTRRAAATRRMSWSYPSRANRWGWIHHRDYHPPVPMLRSGVTRRSPASRNLSQIAVLALVSLLLNACRPGSRRADANIVGNWTSQSVSSRSPFLRQGVARLSPGAYRLTLRQDEQFTWHELDTAPVEGRYHLNERRELVMEITSSGEVVRFAYELDGDRLVVHTPDGFVFNMRREAVR